MNANITNTQIFTIWSLTSKVIEGHILPLLVKIFWNICLWTDFDKGKCRNANFHKIIYTLKVISCYGEVWWFLFSVIQPYLRPWLYFFYFRALSNSDFEEPIERTARSERQAGRPGGVRSVRQAPVSIITYVHMYSNYAMLKLRHIQNKATLKKCIFNCCERHTAGRLMVALCKTSSCKYNH